MWELFWLVLIVGVVGWLIIGTVLDVRHDNAQPYTRHWISRVRVPAIWHDVYLCEAAYGTADFQLGKGPCGLEVTEIYCDWEDNGATFCVKQKCSNGESKTFYYRREDITGRVEVTRDRETINPKDKK